VNVREVLEVTRQAICECAGNDPDEWSHSNRFVFARLQLDERRTKTKIKKELLGVADPSCGYSKCPSRRKRFLYWWDISPSLPDVLDRYDAVAFIKKDTGERRYVPVAALKGYLTEGRRTSRSDGNWGVKILKGTEDQLAFEPGVRGDK